MPSRKFTSDSSELSLGAAIFKALVGVAGQAFMMWNLLMVPYGLLEGHWRWPRAWQYFMFSACVSTVTSIALAILAPKGFAARFRAPFSSTQPLADKHASVLLLTVLLLVLLLIPFDVHYVRLLGVTGFYEALVWAVIGVIGYFFVASVVYFNEYSITYVEDQRSSGQKLVENGPYGLVRHPMYLGMVLVVPGMAGWLGSRAVALLGGPLLLAALVPRIQAEEAMLARTLKGYKGYMARRPWRVVPFVY